jgi:hypothetical protein
MAVKRLKVKGFTRNSNGKSSGIVIGDLILQFNNQDVRSESELTNYVEQHSDGYYALVILRNGEELVVDISGKPLGLKLTEEVFQDVVVKTYKGNQEQATQYFQEDAVKMESEGYYPSNQTWSQGSWGCGAFILALLLCFLIIGILVFIYMLLVKPEGTLTVTYEAKKREIKLVASNTNEKVCPECAETIKAAAKVCRFCQFKFTE